jgi:hypothetical protein
MRAKKMKHSLKKTSNPVAKNKSFSKGRFSKANLTIFAVIFAVIGGYIIYSSFAATPACTQTFTPSTIGTSPYAGNSVNNAVQGGNGNTVICLASGTYAYSGPAQGAIALYNAHPTGIVTIRPADGATVSMGGISMNGVSNVHITGFTSPSNMTVLIQNAGQGNSSNVEIDHNDMPNSGVTIVGNTNANANINVHDNTFIGYVSSPEQSRIVINSNTGCPNGIVIQNNVIGGGEADGIDLGGANCGTIIRGNEIYGIDENNCNGIHCDPIQDNGGSKQTQIINNYLHDDTTGIMAYDGTGGGWVITGNIVANGVGSTQGSIQVGGTANMTIEHNTIWNTKDACGNGCINNGSKAGMQDTNLTVRNNIVADGVVSNGAGGSATYTVNDYNLCQSGCAGTHSLTGSPTFVGGANPTTWAGFALTSTSKGHLAASDGTDMGASYFGSGTITPPTPPPPTPPPPQPPTPPPPTPPPGCTTSSTTWQNTSFSAQTSSFTFDFDATPSASGIDTVTGLSNGAATDYPSLAVIVRFNSTGTIDAINDTGKTTGGNYTAVNSIPYTAATSYHFKLTVNPSNHTYSAVVTPSGGSATTLATNYGFRFEQASTSTLNNWALYSLSGSESVCSATVAATGTTKIGDLNNDGSVNIFDLSILLSKYNTYTASAELNNDGIVNVFDLSILLSHYGT